LKLRAVKNMEDALSNPHQEFGPDVEPDVEQLLPIAS
jgi:hypothetical protein